MMFLTLLNLQYDLCVFLVFIPKHFVLNVAVAISEIHFELCFLVLYYSNVKIFISYIKFIYGEFAKII